MSILVGVIDVHVSYNNNYGAEVHDVSKLVLIKEGEEKDLLEYVRTSREECEIGNAERKELYMNKSEKYKLDMDMPDHERKIFNDELKKNREKCHIGKYKTLMILEGKQI